MITILNLFALSYGNARKLAPPRLISTITYYSTFNPEKWYKRKEQLLTFEKLLGSVEEAAKYISMEGENFLSKGHHTPEGDLPSVFRLATYL